MTILAVNETVKIACDVDGDFQCTDCGHSHAKSGKRLHEPVFVVVGHFGEARYLCDFCALNGDDKLRQAALTAVDEYSWPDEWSAVINIDWLDLRIEDEVSAEAAAEAIEEEENSKLQNTEKRNDHANSEA